MKVLGLLCVLQRWCGLVQGCKWHFRVVFGFHTLVSFVSVLFSFICFYFFNVML